MPNVFVLYGLSNSGETTTLKRVDAILKEKYRVIRTLDEFYSKGKAKDYRLIYEIEVKGKIIRIGLQTGGDDWKCICRDAVKRFLPNNCDIIFCACHSDGSKTKEEIDNNYPKAYFLEKKRVSDSSKWAQVNEQAALELIKMAGLSCL